MFAVDYGWINSKSCWKFLCICCAKQYGSTTSSVFTIQMQNWLCKPEWAKTTLSWTAETVRGLYLYASWAQNRLSASPNHCIVITVCCSWCVDVWCGWYVWCNCSGICHYSWLQLKNFCAVTGFAKFVNFSHYYEISCILLWIWLILSVNFFDAEIKFITFPRWWIYGRSNSKSLLLTCRLLSTHTWHRSTVLFFVEFCRDPHPAAPRVDFYRH